MPIKKTQRIYTVLVAALFLIGLNSKGQDTATVKEVAWLQQATKKAFTFDTTLYQKIQAEFYLAIVECNGKEIKDVSIKEEKDNNLMRDLLLLKLRKELIGHKFNCYYVPKSIVIPIELINSQSKSYSGFDFERIRKYFMHEDTSLSKAVWQLSVITYKGHIDPLDRWGVSEKDGDW